eukprot:7668694-Ditylum_brightwellii.AAC.1
MEMMRLSGVDATNSLLRVKLHDVCHSGIIYNGKKCVPGDEVDRFTKVAFICHGLCGIFERHWAGAKNDGGEDEVYVVEGYGGVKYENNRCEMHRANLERVRWHKSYHLVCWLAGKEYGM